MIWEAFREALAMMLVVALAQASEPPPEAFLRPPPISPTPTATRVETPDVEPPVQPLSIVHSDEDLHRALERWFPDQYDKALRVTTCENTTHDPSLISTNGLHYGLWQFTLETWEAMGGLGLPSNASAEEQTMRARMLYDRVGWQPWPHCGQR